MATEPNTAFLEGVLLPASRSLSDKKMIDDLVRGQEWLFSDTSAKRLLATLRSRLLSITRNIYVLNSFPEQYEDIYDLLVDGTAVVRIEIPRVSGVGVEAFKKATVEEYLRTQLGRPDRRKLLLAVQLAQGKGTA